MKTQVINNEIEFRVQLTDKANKKLTLYKVYKNLISKQEAANQILENLDMTDIRDDFFINDEVKL